MLLISSASGARLLCLHEQLCVESHAAPVSSPRHFLQNVAIAGGLICYLATSEPFKAPQRHSIAPASARAAAAQEKREAAKATSDQTTTPPPPQPHS